MTDIDFDRLQPLRLAAGTHKKGSGFGCAMNVISYITGEAEITDFPACSDGRLSRMVQQVNDIAARIRGTARYEGRMSGSLYEAIFEGSKMTYLLTPKDAIRAVDLGMMTVGTAGTVDGSHITAATREATFEHNFAYLGLPLAETINMAAYAGRNVDALFDLAEDILHRVRKYAGLDAVEDVQIPAGALL